jgi:hypothetical protein
LTWRLLSSNNRDLGRAPARYATPVDCLAAVHRLRRSLREVGSAAIREGLVWGWQAEHAGNPVAVSSRRYQRRVQAESACAAFLRLAAGAAVADTVRLVRFH